MLDSTAAAAMQHIRLFPLKKSYRWDVCPSWQPFCNSPTLTQQAVCVSNRRVLTSKRSWKCCTELWSPLPNTSVVHRVKNGPHIHNRAGWCSWRHKALCNNNQSCHTVLVRSHRPLQENPSFICQCLLLKSTPVGYRCWLML